MNILERGPDGATLHVHGADAVLGEHPLGNVATVQTLFSVDGRFLATVNADHVSIYDTATNDVVRMIPTPGTIAVHFSPTAKFLIVYQKANAAGAGEEKNLTVWNTESGEKLYSCFQKSFSKAEWPYIQFSDDDSIACRVVNNEVHFLRCCDFVAPACRLRVPNVAAAKLSPGVVPTLAAFVPEIKGQPGSVRLYSPPSDNSEGAIESPPLARRSFFRVQEVEFSWARNGVAVLVLGSSEVDATNQSYYGESSLHFMRTDGELDCKVPLDKEGPVHEAAWSPNSEEFVVVYGFMPAKATIYTASKCEPKYQLGAGPHNTVRWNPFGRFICLAGFGNLPGDIKFFDRKADGKYKLVGSTRAACSIWRYNGELIHHAERDKLYEAKWQPALAGTYEDRPISPGSIRKEGDSVTHRGVSGEATARKPAPYRPPHATSGSGNFSLAKAAPEDAGPGKYRPPGAVSVRPNSGVGQTSGPPGASFVDPRASKNAEKNAKKRAAAKAKKAAIAAQQ